MSKSGIEATETMRLGDMQGILISSAPGDDGLSQHVAVASMQHVCMQESSV